MGANDGAKPNSNTSGSGNGSEPNVPTPEPEPNPNPEPDPVPKPEPKLDGRLGIVLLGNVAAGKSTQAEMFANALNLPIIEIEELIRSYIAAGHPLGLKAKESLAGWKPVEDDIEVGMVLDRLSKPDAQEGYLLDGFPRNLAQAQEFDQRLAKTDHLMVVEIDIDTKLIFERCANATDREDYKPVTVQERLNHYDDNAPAVVDFYKQKGILTTVNGYQKIEAVSKDMMAAYQAYLAKHSK